MTSKTREDAGKLRTLQASSGSNKSKKELRKRAAMFHFGTFLALFLFLSAL
jgi:hypothetical protein